MTSIREKRWKLAKYSDIKRPCRRTKPVEEPGQKPPQWEMYDLKTDPYEEVNLAFEGYERTALQEREFLRLKKKLAKVEKTRLRPLAKSRVTVPPSGYPAGEPRRGERFARC